MQAVNLPVLPPKADLWCQSLLLQPTKPMNQHLKKNPFLHISLSSFESPLRRVKSEDWNIGSEDFWTEVEEPHLHNDICASACSDGEQLSDNDNDIKRGEMLKDVSMPKKRMNTFWKSKRKAKRYWHSRRMRRASSLAERRLQAGNLRNAWDPTPSWREKEMTISVFIVVAMVVKRNRPAKDFEPDAPQRGTQRLYTLMCPANASKMQVFREAYLGPAAPPWSPDEDEDDDDIDLSNHRALYCTSCQDEVLLPFDACRKCPTCKVNLT